MKGFHKRHYRVSVKEGVDEFTVSKNGNTEWSLISRTTHGDHCGEVEFRSREALLMVKHMIDDMLRKG